MIRRAVGRRIIVTLGVRILDPSEQMFQYELTSAMVCLLNEAV